MRSVFLIVFCLCVSVVEAKPKDRKWLSGSVVAIEQIPGRVMQTAPAQNYVISTESAEYTLEHAARTYYTSPPQPLVTVGSKVELALDGKNAILKTGATEKKLRVIKTSTPRTH